MIRRFSLRTDNFVRNQERLVCIQLASDMHDGLRAQKGALSSSSVTVNARVTSAVSHGSAQRPVSAVPSAAFITKLPALLDRRADHILKVWLVFLPHIFILHDNGFLSFLVVVFGVSSLGARTARPSPISWSSTSSDSSAASRALGLVRCSVSVPGFFLLAYEALGGLRR